LAKQKPETIKTIPYTTFDVTVALLTLTEIAQVVYHSVLE